MSTRRPRRQPLSQRQIDRLRPTDPDSLHRWVLKLLGVNLVRRAVVPGNQAPFDYLVESFFGGRDGASPGDAVPPRDIVVWAGRGGGKTMLGAIATLLELLFKPGIQVRILGASFQQSSRMYEYLRGFIERRPLRHALATQPTERQIRLFNGSSVRLLTQSPTSVRGEHVHRIRCDEVDDFDPEIWDAAQLATRSGRCGDEEVHGRIEALSTMHYAGGPMSRLMERAGESSSRRLLRWCAIDVMQRCPAARPCEGCKLWNHCLGRAKQAEGYIAVDDMIALFERTSEDVWAAEMMCLRPSRSATVYRSFDPTPGGRHVMGTSPGVGRRVQVGAYSAVTYRFPEERSLSRGNPLEPGPAPLLVGGMDFGIRNPFAMLWARLVPPADANSRTPRPEDWTIEVVDELVEEGLTLDQAIHRIEATGWPRPVWIGVDPTGGQRSRQTGISDIEFLRRRGYRPIAKPARINVGVEILRRRLDRGTLRIDPVCTRLIRSMTEYHFDPDDPQNENPMKDGPDHACDALRYLAVSFEFGGLGLTRVGQW